MSTTTYVFVEKQEKILDLFGWKKVLYNQELWHTIEMALQVCYEYSQHIFMEK